MTTTIKYTDIVRQEAIKNGVDPQLAVAIMSEESNGNKDAVGYKLVKKDGKLVHKTDANGNKIPVAYGLMQLTPATAKRYGVTDALDPQQNASGGTKFLADLVTKFKGDTTKVIAAYNAGEGAVSKYNGVPPFAETQGYVKKVNARLGNTNSGDYVPKVPALATPTYTGQIDPMQAITMGRNAVTNTTAPNTIPYVDRAVQSADAVAAVNKGVYDKLAPAYGSYTDATNSNQALAKGATTWQNELLNSRNPDGSTKTWAGKIWDGIGVTGPRLTMNEIDRNQASLSKMAKDYLTNQALQQAAATHTVANTDDLNASAGIVQNVQSAILGAEANSAGNIMNAQANATKAQLEQAQQEAQMQLAREQMASTERINTDKLIAQAAENRAKMAGGVSVPSVETLSPETKANMIAQANAVGFTNPSGGAITDVGQLTGNKYAIAHNLATTGTFGGNIYTSLETATGADMPQKTINEASAARNLIKDIATAIVGTSKEANPNSPTYVQEMNNAYTQASNIALTGDMAGLNPEQIRGITSILRDSPVGLSPAQEFGNAPLPAGIDRNMLEVNRAKGTKAMVTYMVNQSSAEDTANFFQNLANAGKSKAEALKKYNIDVGAANSYGLKVKVDGIDRPLFLNSAADVAAIAAVGKKQSFLDRFRGQGDLNTIERIKSDTGRLLE